jgi:hypothetical protein
VATVASREAPGLVRERGPHAGEPPGMCRYAARRPALLLDSITSAEIEQLSARTRPTPAFYGLAILLALLAPDVAAFGFLAIAVAAVLLPERSQRGV